MRCPYCSNQTDRVIDSRPTDDHAEIRRRRECLECARRFTTRERWDVVMPKIVKRDERREEFRREKLVVAVQKACEKRPVSADDLEQMVESLEAAAGGEGIDWEEEKVEMRQHLADLKDAVAEREERAQELEEVNANMRESFELRIEEKERALAEL